MGKCSHVKAFEGSFQSPRLNQLNGLVPYKNANVGRRNRIHKQRWWRRRRAPFGCFSHQLTLRLQHATYATRHSYETAAARQT